MKSKTFYFRTDIYRLLTKKETYMGILGVALALFLSVGNRNDITESVIYTLLLSTYNAGFVLCFAFCALPYGSIYSDELENYYIRYAVNRGGLKKYVISKMIIIFASAVLVMGMGCILFSWICSWRLPWIDEQTFQTLVMSGSYVELLKNGNYIVWVGLYGIQWGLFGGCLALLSSYFSLYIRNKLFVLVMPVLLHQIIIEVGTNTFRTNSVLDPLIIFDARYKLFSSDRYAFLWACTFGVCCLIAASIATYKRLQKRM